MMMTGYKENLIENDDMTIDFDNLTVYIRDKEEEKEDVFEEWEIDK